MAEKKIRNDLILVGALIGMLLLVGGAMLLFRSEGDMVVVTVNGETYASYSLAKDTEVDILTGENGTQVNRLIIRDGKAFVESATCPDGICASHKPVSHDGESIICLPHKVVVAIESTK
jgi:hypothetical protein